ncbi:hypothetical protein MtrunA17_Chr2g0311311 [Medicago truncatula]|nr:hypothetical protein MtrunA17_Chr2g0311311 [Medicago truncatula]
MMKRIRGLFIFFRDYSVLKQFVPLQIEFTLLAVQSGSIDGVESSQWKRKRGRLSRDMTPVPETPLAICEAMETDIEKKVEADTEMVTAEEKEFVLDDAGGSICGGVDKEDTRDEYIGGIERVFGWSLG